MGEETTATPPVPHCTGSSTDERPISDARRAAALGYTPLASIRAYAFAGVEPERLGIGPVQAIPKALQEPGLSLAGIDLFELNQAFPAPSRAVEPALGLNRAGPGVGSAA